jgi:hypothetical protein
MKPDYWQKNTRETQSGSRKDRKKWCLGKPGREHRIELMVPPNIPGYIKQGCRWSCWEVGGVRFYLCNHVWICVVCGKHLRDTQPEDCPDYAPYAPPDSSF